MPYQDPFNQNGQVPGNPQSTNWMWGNQPMPTNPLQSSQEYTVPRGGAEADPEYIKKLNDLLSKGYSQEAARKVIAWEQNTLQAPIYEPNVAVNVNEENKQSMDWYNDMIGKKPSVAPWAGDLTGSEGANMYEKLIPFLSPTGSSLETELFMTGRALGQDKGTPGRGLAIAGGIGSAALGASRAGLSGYALSKANQTQEEWMREQIAKGRTGTYTAAPQYGNSNSLGSTSFENGGLFADGGFTIDPNDPTYKKRYKEELAGYTGNPKNAQGIPTAGADWIRMSQVDRDALLTKLKALNPNDINESVARDYYNLSQGKDFFVSKSNPNQTLSPPVDLSTVRGTLPSSFFGSSSTPKAKEKEATLPFVYMLKDPSTGKLSEVDYNSWSTADKNQQVRMDRSESGKAIQPGTGGKYFKDYAPMFEEGGEQMQTPAPQQGGQEEQMQQIAMMVQQMLSQGATPEQVMQALVSQGVPQEMAQQVLQQIMQQAQQPQMAYGGLFKDTNSDPVVNFNKNVGDKVEFSVGSKKYKGKIKKIENGKFYI